ncbi:MAG: proteasome assembly chaperone family protein [Nitrososphaeraceae archaeon]
MSTNESAKIIETEESEKSDSHNGTITTNIDGRTSIRYTHKFNRNDGMKLDNAVLIAGFSGPGLIGSIGANYIIEKLNMHQIACIDSEFIVPGVIYIGGKLRHPFRIYMNEEGDIYVLECEAPIMIQGIHSVLSTATRWCVNNDIKKVIVLEGYPVRGIPSSGRQPIILSSDDKEQGEMLEKARLREIESTNNSNNQKRRIRKRQFENAFIGGISGGLLSACLSNEIPCAALLIPTTTGMPDPEGAASLIEIIGKIAENEKLNLDSKQLRKEGAGLRKQMEEIIRSLRDQQQIQQEGEGIREQRQVMYG